MNILQIVPYFPPYNGGQERYVFNLSKHMAKKGHRVHIITSNYPKYQDYELLPGISIERHRFLARPLRNPISPGFFLSKEDINNFDVIHTHNEHSIAAMAAAYHSKKNNKPLVLTCHGQLKFDNPYIDRFENIYSRLVGARLFDASDLIVSLSESDKKYISSFNINPEKILVIPNAIDLGELGTENGVKKSLDALGESIILKGKFKVLFVGPIIKRKGVEYLIRAIPGILRSLNIENIIFILTGIGDFSESMKQLASELGILKHILFTGYLSKEVLNNYYTISDLFVLPSFSEGLPTSILEAMYFGLPVISTDIPGVRDHFKDYAILIPPGDSESLEKAIVKILADRNLSEKLSRNGKRLVLNEYSWDIVADRYEKLYELLEV